MVLVAGAGMQGRVVVEKLDVARLEIHVEEEILADRQRPHIVDGPLLQLGQREAALLRAQLDLPLVEAAAQDALVVAEHGDLGIADLRRRLALADQVEMEALGQRLDVFRAGGQDLVVDRHGIADPAEAAGLRRADAEETHDVAAVGMRLQVGVRPVPAHALLVIAALGVLAAFHVGHDAEQVALRVLGDDLAEMGSEPPVQHLERVEVVVGDVEAAQQDEAAAVLDVVQDPRELGAERRQGEIRLAERERPDAAALLSEWDSACLNRA